MNKRFILGTTLAMALVTTSVMPTLDTDAKGKNDRNGRDRAKNVIVLVGDGMGTPQRDAIRLATVGLKGELAMDSMPYSGRVHTNSADPKGFVTDSAAAATAMSTGVKTYNGAIGVDVNGKPVESVMELAKKQGKSTGVVTTSQVTDATGAAWGAHVASRSDQSEIASQYLEHSKPNVILGGGENYWYPAGNPGAFLDNPPEDTKEASKGQKGNLVDLAKQKGYTYVTNEKELNKANGSNILGLFANEEMFQANAEGQGDIYNPVVSLPKMTEKAIDTLSNNKKGFFLVVEEEGTDEFGSSNNGEKTIKSGQELDKAVAVAKKFAKQNGNTLVLVAADHGVGGLSIESVNEKDESGSDISAEDGPFAIANSNQQFVMDWTTTGHSANDIPLTAMGPGSELLSGVYENTNIYDAIKKALNLKGK